MTRVDTNYSAHHVRAVADQPQRTKNVSELDPMIADEPTSSTYWKISSETRAGYSSVNFDRLVLEASTVDITHMSLSQTVEILDSIKDKLVEAEDDNADRTAIQKDIDEMRSGLSEIASSFPVDRENWLSTDIPDIYDPELASRHVVASFLKAENDNLSVQSIDFGLSSLSLVNSTGGGILQADTRSPGNIGGLRGVDTVNYGSAAAQQFQFEGPLLFADSFGEISFDLIVDADDPSTTPPPAASGKKISVAIDRSLVDEVLPSSKGIVNRPDQMYFLLQKAMEGKDARASMAIGGTAFSIGSKEKSGLPGSSLQLVDLRSNLIGGATGGLKTMASPVYGTKPLVWTHFEGPFRVHKDVSITFDVTVNENEAHEVKIDRNLVDRSLGTATGEISSAEDLEKVLTAGLQGSGVNVAHNGFAFEYSVDGAVHKETGSKSVIRITNVDDDLGPAPDFDLADLDVRTEDADVPNFILGIEGMIGKAAKGAALMGDIKARIGLHTSFATQVMDRIDGGILQFLDPNMDDVAAKPSAEQTRQLLKEQTLAIANTSPELLTALLRRPR